MKYDLTNFSTIKIISGIAQMSITRNGISFSQTTIQTLGNPEYVDLLVDEKEKVLALKASETGKDDSDAIQFLTNEKLRNNKFIVRWNNRELLKKISAMMNWDLKDQGYRIEGDFDNVQNAMFFNLNQAKLMKSSRGGGNEENN